MFVYKIILFMFYVTLSQCRLPDKVYCVNEECSEPLTKAKTLLSYNSIDADLMSFRINTDATVYMKSAGSESDLWYVNINGKSGFVPKKFLREYKVFVKDPLVTVPFDAIKHKSENLNVQPNKVQLAHEVIEGTTIYTTEASSEQESTTENPGTKPTDIETPKLITKNDEQSDAGANFISENSDSIKQSTTQITEPPQSDSNEEEKKQTVPETVDNKPKTEQNVEQVNQVLPNLLADALSPPDSGASSSETIEVPDLNYVQNTLNEPENVDSNELNTSLPHLNKKHKLHTDTSTETPGVSENNQFHAEGAESTADESKTDQNVNAQSVNGVNPEEVIIDVISGMLKDDLLNEAMKKDVDTHKLIHNSIANENIENDKTNVVSQNPKLTEYDKVDSDAQTEQNNDEVTRKYNEDVNETAEKEPVTPENKLNAQIKQSNDTEEAATPKLNEEVDYTTQTDTVLKAQAEQSYSKKEEETTVRPTEEVIQTTQTEPIVPESLLEAETEHNNEANVKPNEQTTESPSINSVIPPENDMKTKTESVSTDPPTTPSVPLTSETIPPLEIQNSIPATNIPEVPTTTTEVPPVQNPSTETLPPLFSYPKDVTKQASSTPNINSNYYNEPIKNDPYKYYMKEPAVNEPLKYDNPEQGLNGPPDFSQEPKNVFSTDNSYKESEPSSSETVEEFTAQPQTENDDTQEEYASTEAPSSQEENTEGFISSIYSTIADIWPTTTEAPPSHFNEDQPKFEEQNNQEEFSVTKYLTATYYSVFGPNEEMKALFPSHGETCFTDEYCDGKGNGKPNRLLTFLVTAASSVLLFTLGYYYIDSKRQDSRLIGNINSLQRDLMFSTKECEILKEELSTTKRKLAGIEDSSFGMDDMVLSLKEEINEHKAQNERLRNSLDDNEKLLRVSENTAGELQNTLSDVENTLSELWGERANFEEQIAELNGKIQAFEEELISVSRDRDTYQLKYVSAETALEESKKYKKQLDDMNQQLTEAKNTIELQKHELTALKDAMKQLRSGGSNNLDVSSLIDHTEIKAKLNKALEEKNTLSTKYEVELAERKRISDELQTTQDSYRTTSQQATEAMTRLEVLGKYFQERESELMKELNTKESLWLSKQGESASTVEKIELLQQEVQRFKEKCDALTLELAEQESNRRTAISEVETRAHAAWLEARTARREADAARDEAATLRRKLASVSADVAIDPHHKVASPLDVSEGGVIPPPLPPLAFLPPLLPPLPRPPPLGRLPSPHPPRYGGDRRYTPESRYSPETVRYSPDSRYSPRRRSPYSPRSRRRERYEPAPPAGRSSRNRNGPAPDTETEYNSDSPSRAPHRRRYRRHSDHSGPSSGSGCSSDSGK